VPRELIVADGHDRSRSLGWLSLAWMEALVVHGPGDVQGDPVVHGDEMSQFVADCYVLDERGRRLYDSAFLSRPKGCDKSGQEGRFGLFEALGPCRFGGWARGGEVYRDPWGLGFEYEYQPGEPMGRPVKVPFIRCMATEEGQTGNVYDTIYFNLTEGPLSEAMLRRDDAGLTRTLLPGGGEITPSTASSAAKDGGKETFVAFDETHLYNTPELRRMYAVVTRNLRKRKRIAETWFLEGTTMFAAGEDSVAEATYKLMERIREGRAARQRLLADHRWGECEDLTDEDALRAALEDAYGDAMGWNDLDGLINEFFEGRAATAESRRYFLNSPQSTVDAWLTEYEWTARGPRRGGDGAEPPAKGDVITLGFDGSRKRARGVTDATALIGCRVRDGHLFQLQVWEQPSGQSDWQVPTSEVDAEVRAAFERYQVVGFYADPAKWETYVADWEARYGGRLKVKATREHPIQWWMTGGRASLTVRALEKFESAVVDGELTHDGASELTRHVLNARRRVSRTGVQIAKEHPESSKKIDAAVAAVLAWQARLDAVAAGLGKARGRPVVPRRLDKPVHR
jgi:hypothetical protein